MSFRNLDGDNDWTFGASLGNYATENNEIALDIQTRVLSFYNDCFFDTEEGINYFGLLEYNKQEELEQAIKTTILKTNGVVGCDRLNLYVNAERKMTLEYTVQTIYSSTVENKIDLTTLNSGV